MLNFDNITKENKNEHNLNWPQIPDHSYIILIIGDSGYGKANIFNPINHQQDIDKIHLYAKLTKEKVQAHIILIIRKLLLNTQMI